MVIYTNDSLKFEHLLLTSLVSSMYIDQGGNSKCPINISEPNSFVKHDHTAHLI